MYPFNLILCVWRYEPLSLLIKSSFIFLLLFLKVSQTEFHIDEKMRQNVLKDVCLKWKDFKTKLVSGWITKTRKLPDDHKEPYETYDSITQAQWEIFKKNRETEEFKVYYFILCSSEMISGHIVAFCAIEHCSLSMLI